MTPLPLPDIPIIERPDQAVSQMLTVREAATILNVSASLVYHLIGTRQLACHRVGAKRGTIRILKEDIDEYLAACRSDRIERVPRTTIPHLKHIKL